MFSIKRKSTTLCLLALLAAAGLFPVAAVAQLNSAVVIVPLAATKGESLTVAAAGAPVFDLATTVASGSVPVVITTSWVLNPAKVSVSLYGYFATATAALTDGAGNNIPSASVKGKVATGAPTVFTAFTQSPLVGTAGATLTLFTEAIGGANKNKTRVDNLDLQIDQTGLILPAGTYTGTLSIQAQAL